MNTAFKEVFDDKLKRIKKTLKHEFDKDHPNRNKKLIKTLIKEAKELRNLLKELDVVDGGCKCPKCGHEFVIGE